MTHHLPWQIAFEAIAHVPFMLGFHPSESAVVVTYRTSDAKVIIGPSARFDLDVFTADGGELVAVGILDKLAAAEPHGAMLLLYGERSPQFWADAVDLLTAAWPFVEHGGHFRIAKERIEQLGWDGEVLSTRDTLELFTTQVAMQEPAQALGDDERSLRFARSAAAETESADALGAELDGLPIDRRCARMSRALKRSHRRGAVESVEEALTCAAGLDVPEMRDGYIAWVLDGATISGDLDLIEPMGMVWSAAPPDTDTVATALRTLASISAPLPVGRAASPLAAAAYLSWYSGRGAQARVLATQAAEEDPHHTLAALVLEILAASCPPPWAGREPVRSLQDAHPAASDA